jgi:hypothetical protein
MNKWCALAGAAVAQARRGHEQGGAEAAGGAHSHRGGQGPRRGDTLLSVLLSCVVRVVLAAMCAMRDGGVRSLLEADLL